MGTKHFYFESYEDGVSASDRVTFEIDVNDFKIDEDCIINSAAYISIEGEVLVVNSVVAVSEGNYFAFNVPDDIKSDDYKFKISVCSISSLDNTAIIESLGYINIDGDGGWNTPPAIENLHFMAHSSIVPVADITGDFLAISGSHLDYVTDIKVISPTIFFNIIFHSKNYIKAKAISAPRVQGLRLVYPRLEYTIKTDTGEFVSSGEIRSNIPLRIQGD